MKDNVKHGCGCLFFTVALLLGGGQGVYTVLTSGTAEEVTLAEYKSERPTSSRINLRNGVLDYSRALVLFGNTPEVYIPVYQPNELADKSASALVLWHTKDKR